MDQNLIRKHLAKVQRRIAEGEISIARQRGLIARAELNQRDCEAAQLRSLEDSQSGLLATRDAINATLLKG